MNDFTQAWRKSSRSADHGGNCVEVGAWRTGSRSASNAGQNCVEVGTCSCDTIAIRDSKNPHGGVLAVGVGEWSRLLHSLGRD